MKRLLCGQRDESLSCFSAFCKSCKISVTSYRVTYFFNIHCTTKLRQNVVYLFSIFHGEVNFKFGYDDFTDSSKPIKPLEIFLINNNNYCYLLSCEKLYYSSVIIGAIIVGKLKLLAI